MKHRIVLLNLPYWSPLIPVQGIACLKSYLAQNNYYVKTYDLAVNHDYTEIYYDYFGKLKALIPSSHWGNFLNIGHDVLRNHMMASINKTVKNEAYFELIRQIVYNTYYYSLTINELKNLDLVIDNFYKLLKSTIERIIKDVNPTVVGASVSSGSLASSLFVFRTVKQLNPNIKTVMGGSVFYNHLALDTPDYKVFYENNHHWIDKIIIGKGEVLLLDYLKNNCIDKKISTIKDIDKEVLSKYPCVIPDLSDFNLDQYLYLAGTASTSCPHSCGFCNSKSFFGEYKIREMPIVVKELIGQQEKYGHKLFFMTDSLLNPVINDFSKELLDKKTDLYFDGYFRIDEESTFAESTCNWRRAGFYRARLGTESGSQKILNSMDKQISPTLINKALEGLANAGIKTTTYWVVGYPGETEQDFQDTLNLIKDSRDSIWQAECNPFTYYYTGQAHNNNWHMKRKGLYSDEFRQVLLVQTWTLDISPEREEIYNRVFRFEEFCKKIGIPNPYSFSDLHLSDKRWKNLHKNAVPSILSLKTGKIEKNEKLKVQPIHKLKKIEIEDNFSF